MVQRKYVMIPVNLPNIIVWRRGGFLGAWGWQGGGGGYTSGSVAVTMAEKAGEYHP